MSVNRVDSEEKLQKSDFPVNYSRGKRSGNRKRGNGKDKIFTGFQHYRMDDKQQGLISELKDFQMGCSWVPLTPAKPGLTRRQPICTEWQDNQAFQANWLERKKFSRVNQIAQAGFDPTRVSEGFLQDAPAQYIAACCDSTNAANIHGGLDNSEASVAEFQVNRDDLCIYKFINDEDMRSNVSFGELLARAHAAGTNAAENESLQTVFNATSSSFALNFPTKIDGRQYTTTSENSSLAVESNSMPNITTGGSCIHSMPFLDLNLPSGMTDATLSEMVSSQFAPITPEKTARADDRQQLGVPNLSINEMLGIKDAQQKETSVKRVELEGLHHNKEQSQLVVDQLCETMSTQLEENHKPDKGGTGDIDLSRTPQQKPRRKKHRPKVIIEGQSQITPKPRVERSADPQETTKGKRKYVWRKGVNNPTAATPFEMEINGTDTITKPLSAKETTNVKRKYARRGVNKPESNALDQEACETTDPKTGRQTRNSCRRSLKFDSEGQMGDESNFDMEPQAQNYNAEDQSGSSMQCGLGREATINKTKVSIAYDLPCPMKQVMEGYQSKLEGHYSSSSPHTKTDTLHDKLTFTDQKTCTRGKCQIVFSDFPHDKEGNTVQVIMNSNAQLTPKSPSESDCSSSTCLMQESQERDLKRQHMGTNVVAEFCRSNSTGTFHNSLQAYSAIFRQNAYNYGFTPGIHFPAMYKTKRIEKGQNSAISSTHTIIASENRAITALEDTQNEQQNFIFLSTLGPTEMLEKKRTKETAPVSNLGSLLEMCKQVLGSPGHGATTSKTVDSSAKMTTKKRSKRKLNFTSTLQNIHSHHQLVTRKMGSPLAKTWICRSPVDAIIEQCNRLDLNAESSQDAAREHNAFMAYHMNYQEQHALVPYQRNGALVPFDSSFYQGKRRRPRPKVDLDDETNRVWKLLLENINSEGIDGTDEEKEKWWEEERRVFHGRADSFIARMHLVQGDRRFSPWKGSVLDSVIGVFLTQNVSDHLSSSAFMSLAARFPFEPECNQGQSCQDKVSIIAKEPEVRDLDPDDTIGWDEVLNPPTCSKDSKMLLDSDNNDIREVVNSVKSSGNSFEGTIPKVQSGQLSGFFKNGPDASHESTMNKSIGFVWDERDLDDTLSSQNSMIYSQNSADSIIALTAERTESCSLSTLEAEPPAGSKPSSIICSTSYVKLSRMERTILHGDNNQGNENISSNMDRQIESVRMVPDTQNQNENQSDITCSKPAFHLPPSSGAHETGHFDIPQKNGESSNIANVKELCETELSGSSAESATQATMQKFLPISCEVPKFCSEKVPSSNHLIDVYQKIAESPTGKLESQFQFQDNKYKMQEASNIPIFPQNSTDITGSSNIDNSRMSEHKEVDSNLKDPSKIVIERKAKGEKIRKEKHNPVDWGSLRKQAQEGGTRRERTANSMDSVDWDAVRCADVNEIAHTIRERGMNNMLAERIKDFLNRLVRDHGSIDLEWLRDIPPDKAKEYLLSVRGLGLKSVECVRLLTLHHLAFPVDTNVGRIAVRLGWVPLQPLPESLQLHLLELYPVLESIQKYLWPRLCKLDQRTLYELHYQMITFGKVFCTKSKPNCNACPMRGECRHFASAFASARLALPAPEEKSTVSAIENNTADQNAVKIIKSLWLPLPQANQLEAHTEVSNSEPIIEVPATPEPIVEAPATPEPDQTQVSECDIEDNFEDPDSIPTIQLNMEKFTQNLQAIMQKQMEVQEGDMSKALVALTPEAASIPMPKLKNVNRLRTEHQVYELPDSHPLLQRMDKREPDDPCSYLLAIWTPGETADSIQAPERHCSSQESANLCTDETCFSCNSIREGNSQTVRGTLLIPCRTAMRGSFPLNGTYFQVNEVFADHESSLNPINVPRDWLWDLPRRTVYFGTSIPTIFKGLSTEGIQYCFWRGFVCVRGFDRETRAPRPLIARLHFPASKLTKLK